MTKYEILKEYEDNLMNLEDFLGSKSTDNIQLNSIGKFLFSDRFKGVYASNEFPIYIKNREMFIINTDDKSKKGSHWITCYKWKDKIYAYDTFNRPIKDLSKFWKNKKNIVDSNANRYESYTEANCGQSALAYLLSFDKHHTKVFNII